LAYLAATNTLALLRLLPMSDRDKDIEILALRHQLLVLQRQARKPVFTETDRAILAGLLHQLPKDKLRHLLLLVRPDTILRWHRNLLKRRHATTCTPKRRGRPPTVRSVRALILSLAQENSSWGYRRIHGELATLGIKAAASTVWEILREHGVPPAPQRHSTTWADFLRSQADALLACDFFETRTLTGARLYVFAVIDHSTRRIRVLGVTTHPTAQWVVQVGHNLLMDLEDAASRSRFLIRDRDSKFTQAFDGCRCSRPNASVSAAVEHPEESGKVGGTGRVIRVAGGLEWADLRKDDVLPGQDVDQGQQGSAGVAIGEGVEERHVEVCAGRACRQRDVWVGRLAQAGSKVGLGTRGQAVALAAGLRIGVVHAERCLCFSEDLSLPAGQQGEVQRDAV
jgi:transposase